jgi:hypothetical protein
MGTTNLPGVSAESGQAVEPPASFSTD